MIFPERGQVGRDAHFALRAAVPDAERDDLVEDKHDAVAVAQRARLREEPGFGQQQADAIGHGLDQKRGDLVVVRIDVMAHHLGVVERQHDDAAVGAGQTRSFGDRVGRVARAGVRDLRTHRPAHVVVRAVVTPFELHDRGAGRRATARAVGAREPHGHHDSLAAGVREADAFRPRQPLEEQLGQRDLVQRGRVVRGAVRRLRSDRRDHRRVRVSERQRRCVEPEVGQRAPVRVGHGHAACALHEGGVRAAHDGVARIAPRKDTARAAKMLDRSRRQLAMARFEFGRAGLQRAVVAARLRSPGGGVMDIGGDHRGPRRMGDCFTRHPRALVRRRVPRRPSSGAASRAAPDRADGSDRAWDRRGGREVRARP